MRTGIVFATASLAAGMALAQEAPPPPPQPPAPHAGRVLVARQGASYLGIGVADLDQERAKALKLADEHGAEVKSVATDSPAAKAGIKVGDVILEFNGQRVEGQQQLVRMVREMPAGREVRLTLWRNGVTQNVTATMGKRGGNSVFLPDGREFHFEMPDIRIPPMPDLPSPTMSLRSGVLGIVSESLNSQLAQYFGVKEGVLVRSVLRGTPAEKAGIKAGDVILKVDGTSVTTPREISSVLRGLRGAKRTFPVVLMREHKQKDITVTLEEPAAPRPGARAWQEEIEQAQREVARAQELLQSLQ